MVCPAQCGAEKAIAQEANAKVAAKARGNCMRIIGFGSEVKP
jgi:hypothetical protein